MENFLSIRILIMDMIWEVSFANFVVELYTSLEIQSRIPVFHLLSYLRGMYGKFSIYWHIKAQKMENIVSIIFFLFIC